MRALFSSKPLTPSSQKPKPPRVPKENQDPNVAPSDSPYKSPGISKIFSGKIRSPLPPRPALKRKLSVDLDSANSPSCNASDSGVQVIVRIRPPFKEEEEEESVVQKLTADSVSISDHSFTFDSVADTGSTQDDVFRLVGLPLVENCLAGFNSSIFAYGQTGSGKTYTMWGPSSALLEENSLNSERGLTPRVFERLFARISEEQTKHANKELTYHCTCSFLEIYNEQITDLLDPTQRNLQIREDVGTGVYVDSLTVEYVESLKDVTQLLIKGLANRRTGATSVNAESSRSHCVFTCVIRSQFKNVEDGMNAARISRINLVDLAGSERQKLTGAFGDRLKEAGNINKSLSQLGNLINILGEISQSGKQRHIPYRDSKLTFLLQESLGGNAKLAMICGVSPSLKCKNETLSTLRFAQRAKAIKNKAVVNETTQDDVKMLREQVRLLRDELVRIKSNKGAPTGAEYSTVEDARRTVKLLRMSLTCTSVMPSVKEDSDEEMEIDENDVEKPHHLSASSAEKALNTRHVSASSAEKGLNGLDSASTAEKGLGGFDSASSAEKGLRKLESPKSLSIVPVQRKSVSPLSESQSRKSPKTSSCVSPSQKAVQESSEIGTESLSKELVLVQDRKRESGETGTKSLSKEIVLVQDRKTDSLAASINRGLEVFETGTGKKKKEGSRRASFSFFVRPVSPEPVPVDLGLRVCKVDVGTQTVSEELEEVMREGSSVSNSVEEMENTGTGLELVPVDFPVQGENLPKKINIPKAVKDLLVGSIRREMDLESQCVKQNDEILQLNRLVQQYKHERECNAIIAQTREDKISRLETLMDGVLPTEEFMEEEFLALQKEHKHLQNMYENHPELLYTTIELDRAKTELEKYKKFFDMDEREVLLEEIHDLKTELNYHLSSPSSSLLLRRSSAQNATVQWGPLDPIPELDDESQRDSWQETEAKWVTLTKDLEMELDSVRKQKERMEIELEAEKRCSEELKEAVQMAVQGHARILDQYADLQEKHINLLAKNRRICEGIEDVKKAAAKAGVGRNESRFINGIAQEISVLRLEREKERKYWRDENKGLQSQLREMAEAVQAAGELVVRLKQAEETAKREKKRARLAEQETEKAYQEIENLKKNYDNQILLLKDSSPLNAPQNIPQIPSADVASSLNISQNLPQIPTADVAASLNISQNIPHADVAGRLSILQSEPEIRHADVAASLNESEISHADVAAKYDTADSVSDQKWREEFEPFGINNSGEVSKETDPRLWFFGHDKCNI